AQGPAHLPQSTGERARRRSWVTREQNMEDADEPPSDVETVRGKLGAIERDIQAAESELRAVSLQAALSEDPDAGYDTVARLNQLRSKRELLVNALAAAEQAAAERKAALHAREWVARKRSLAQKTGQLVDRF